MSDRQWIPSWSGPFEIAVYPGTEKVEYIRCQICKHTVFDDHEPGAEAAFDAALVSHLALSHGDRYEVRP